MGPRLSVDTRWRNRKAFTTVEVTVISVVAMILAVFLLYVAASWYAGSALEATEEIDKQIEMIRAAMMIENISVNYTPMGSKADISVRNVAKSDLRLRILMVELLTIDNRVMVRESLIDQGIVLGKGEVKKLRDIQGCRECQKGEILRYRVWYAADKPTSDLAAMMKRAAFVEASFVHAVGGASLSCPDMQTNDVLVVDIVDPILHVEGTFLSNVVEVRPALKFIRAYEKVNLYVTVESLRDGKVGTGLAENVDVTKAERVSVRGDFQGLRIPLKISIYANYPGDAISSPYTVVMPREWVFDGQPNRVIVSGISLLWRDTDYKVHTILVELGSVELSESIRLRVSVRIIDCYSQLIEEVEATETIPPGIDLDRAVFIRLRQPVRIDQIYFVETRLSEVG